MPTGTLSKAGKDLWESVYEESKKNGDSKEVAARKAWSAVKSAGWEKDPDGNWVKKESLCQFSLVVKKVSKDPETGQLRWRADTSDIGPDLFQDNMTLELFTDFITRIANNEKAPKEFSSDFWSGGLPYLSISHYLDLDGAAVPGRVEELYVDGQFLKAKGVFSDTPLGMACWNSLKEDLKSHAEKPIRISIAFLDFEHRHKSNGFVFLRKFSTAEEDYCPVCASEARNPDIARGKEYLKGLLLHLALTRVPANVRTKMEVEKSMTTRKEDAESIVGEELAKELEEKSTLINRSEAVVIRSEDEEEHQDELHVQDVSNEFHQMKSSLDDLRNQINSLTEILRAKFMKDEEEEKEDDEEDEEEEKKKKKNGEYVEEKSVPFDAEILRASFVDAVAPVAQKLDILIAVMSDQGKRPADVTVRRSISPATVQTHVQQAQQDVSGRPLSIADFARRSTGG